MLIGQSGTWSRGSSRSGKQHVDDDVVSGRVRYRVSKTDQAEHTVPPHKQITLVKLSLATVVKSGRRELKALLTKTRRIHSLASSFLRLHVSTQSSVKYAAPFTRLSDTSPPVLQLQTRQSAHNHEAPSSNSAGRSKCINNRCST